MRARATASTAAPLDSPHTGAPVPDGRRLFHTPMLAIGAVCIIAGGLVAAITASTPSEKASWAAAYLVLVAGVAQIALALAQAAFDSRATAPTWAHVVAGGWSAGNALVLAGTLTGVLVLADAGGLLLLATLVLLLPGLRHPAQPGSTTSRWLLRGIRALVVLLVVSIPVGLVLARFRS